MAITIEPITDDFAAEVGDIDLSRDLSDDEFRTIDDAFNKYSVLIFVEQDLTHDEHVRFAQRFGPSDLSMSRQMTNGQMRLKPEIADVSNINEEGRVWEKDSRTRAFQMGNRLWHTDSSFKYVPAKASLLYGREVAPIGGHTEFADLRAAYDALDDAMKARIEGLVALHCIRTSRAKLGFTEWDEAEKKALPEVPQVVVRTHEGSGRKSLYLASHAGEIVGLPKEEGAALLEQLTAHATRRQFVYTHRWRRNDLVMWDNRCTMHRGTHFDDLRYRRDVQRATILDRANTCEMEGIPVPQAAE